MLLIDIAFSLFSGDMVFMTAEINVRQYVSLIKLRYFGTNIKCLTVQRSMICLSVGITDRYDYFVTYIHQYLYLNIKYIIPAPHSYLEQFYWSRVSERWLLYIDKSLKLE